MTRREWHKSIFLFGLSSVFFFFPLLTGRVHFAGDILYSFQPWLSYLSQNLQAGRLPFWNPYSACGEPFLANPQNMVFYPGAQMFWLFSFARAWPLFMLLHAALLWTGVFLLVKQYGGRLLSGWLACLALTWGGFTVVHWEFPSAFATLAMAPFFILNSLKPRWAALTIACGLLFLSGYPQFSLYALLAGGAWTLFRLLSNGMRMPYWKGPLRWVGGVAAGLLLFLPQGLLSWEAVHESIRMNIGEGEAKSFLLTPWFLIKFLVPDLFNKIALPFSEPAFGPEFWPVQRNWLNTFFIGTAPVLLSIAAPVHRRNRRVWFWGIMGLFGAGMAMGVEPLFSIIQHSLPGFSQMTHFSNFMLLSVVSMAFLAEDGLAVWPEGQRRFWAVGVLALVLVGGLIVSPSVRLYVLQHLLEIDTLAPAQTRHIVSAAGKSAAALAVVCAVVFLVRKRFAVLFLISLLTVTELWLFGRGLHPTVPSDFFQDPVRLAKILSATDERYIIHPQTVQGGKVMAGESLMNGYQSIRQALYPNIHLPFRIRSAWGYEVFPIQRFTEFRRAIPEDALFGPQLDFLGGRYILTTFPLKRVGRLLARAPHALLYVNDSALPIVTWVRKTIVKSNPSDRLDFLASHWEPHEEIVLENELVPGTSTAPPGRDPVGLTLWREKPGRLTAHGDGEGWLVYSQTFYPGWTVTINGLKKPLILVNHAFQGVRTPMGSWEVVLFYRPALFYRGVLCALIVCGILLVVSFRQWGWKRTFI